MSALASLVFACQAPLNTYDSGVEEESSTSSNDDISDDVLDTIHSIYTLQNITPKSSVEDWIYSLHNVCLASMGLGRYTEGLQLCQWECATWRILAKDKPKEFDASLVVCLTNLTACLTYLDRDDEALIAIEEAIKVQRTLHTDISLSLSLERRAGGAAPRLTGLTADSLGIEVGESGCSGGDTRPRGG